MTGEERRDKILKLLKEQGTPLSGTALAQRFQVSRQIIVQDIALMRAESIPILSTNKGYIIRAAASVPQQPKRVFFVKHSRQQVLEEFLTVLELGGKFLDVAVEHEIYGQICVDLLIETESDAVDFYEKLLVCRDNPLNVLTDGCHNHTVSAPGQYRDGYFYLDIRAGDVIEVKLEMLPKLYRCNPRVAANSGLGAVMVGPVVYCAEGADNDGDVFSFTLDGSCLTRNTRIPTELAGFPEAAFDLGPVYTVTAGGTRLLPEDPDALYFTGNYREESADLKLIPYFMWSNRGLNQMRVWFPVK